MPKVLTLKQVEDYKRDGFLWPLRIFSAAEADTYRHEVENMEADAGGKFRGLARTKFYLRYPWAYKVATHPRILDIMEDLIGPNILLYQNTSWLKNAGTDSFVSWHQDNTYYGIEPCEVLSIWIALSPSRPDSGSMRFLPGSQKLGQLPLKTMAMEGNMLSSGQTADVDESAFTPVATSLETGEASIHHGYLVHGSPPNVSKERRMGITFVYMPTWLHQVGNIRTSAMLVRGEDRFHNFDPEEPPLSADDPATIARQEKGAALYRAKVQEMGNRTVSRYDAKATVM